MPMGEAYHLFRTPADEAQVHLLAPGRADLSAQLMKPRVDRVGDRGTDVERGAIVTTQHPQGGRAADLLEAKGGFLEVFGKGKWDAQHVTRALGPDWDIVKYMAVKLVIWGARIALVGGGGGECVEESECGAG